MTGGIDIDALKAALAVAEAKASDAAAEIAFLRLTIEKLRRELYGWRSERKSRLLDQLELQLDELEASATEDELAAERAVAGTTEVKGFTRRKPARKPRRKPAAQAVSKIGDLPRERRWWCRRRHPAPAAARTGCRRSRRMCWRPNACTATTRRCRCWPGARPPPGGPGSMSATMRRSAVRTRRRRCSATRGTGPAITRSSICGATPGSSRLTPMPATTASMRPEDRRGLSPRQRAGRIPGGSSSSSPTSRPASDAARTRRRSRPWRWRR